MATFDDASAVAAPFATVPAVALPLASPYLGLYYQGWGFISTVRTNGAPGIVPQSGNNYAFSDAVETTNQGSAQLTVKYAGSTVKSFSLYSWYYGCVLNLFNGATGVPTACDITVTAFAAGDDTNAVEQVASIQFSYYPTIETGPQNMVEFEFDDRYTNLQYVLVEYNPIGGDSLEGDDLAIVIDNVDYDTCS